MLGRVVRGGLPYAGPVPVAVRIPELLTQECGGLSEVSLDAATVDDVITGLDTAHPGMRERLIDDSGLRRYWAVYVNGRDIRLGSSLATELAPGDVVWILPTSSGGMYLP